MMRARNPSVACRLGQRKCQVPAENSGWSPVTCCSSLSLRNPFCALGVIQWAPRGCSQAQRGGGGRGLEGTGRAGMGSHSLARVSSQTSIGPVTPMGGSWAPGRWATQREPAGGTGNRRSHPREVTHRQKAETGVRDQSAAPGRGRVATRAVRQADRQTGEVKQTGRWPARQTPRETDSQKGRQTDRRPCGWQSLPGRSRQTVGPRACGSLGREAPVGLSECGCHPCPAGRVCRVGGRGGCGEQLPAGPAHQAAGPSLGE